MIEGLDADDAGFALRPFDGEHGQQEVRPSQELADRPVDIPGLAGEAVNLYLGPVAGQADHPEQEDVIVRLEVGGCQPRGALQEVEDTVLPDLHHQTVFRGMVVDGFVGIREAIEIQAPNPEEGWLEEPESHGSIGACFLKGHGPGDRWWIGWRCGGCLSG